MFLAFNWEIALAQTSTNSFLNFETAPVHPIAISPDHSTLAALNLPDGRLELFDLQGDHPSPIGAISVGVDPVSVRFRTANEIWVVNSISDSISIIELPHLRVAATLATGDGPADVVFAGNQQRAFVSCPPTNVVQVFDPLSAARPLIRTVLIDGDRPKAMAVSPNGEFVYVSIFESGNASTILAGEVSTLNSFPPPSVADFPNGPHGGQNPPPNNGNQFLPAINPDIPETNPPPRVGLIVKKNDAGEWMDDNGGNWTQFVSGTNSFLTGRPAGWDVSDHDVAILNTATLNLKYIKRLMNICMDLAVNPATGQITVVGTDASNEVRFEPVLNGIFVKAKLALVSADGTNKVINDLNPHLDYKKSSVPLTERTRSIGDPRAIVWNAAGTRAYVAGMGSDNILLLDREGRPDSSSPALKVQEGPVGLALDEARHRLYVLNRFSNSISVIDTERLEIVETLMMFDPTPAIIRAGRKHFYNTHETSGLGQLSCASCHVDGRFDRLAWDLGAPGGTMQPVTTTNRNFSRFAPAPGERHDFHPMKGPMVTQTLQDIIGHEPFHWRGDRDGLEQFNGTFTNLQGAAVSLTTNEMSEFKGFLATIHFPPNPYRTFSNTFPSTISLSGFTALGHREQPAGTPLPNGSPQQGMDRFRLQGQNGCIHCHTLPTGLGPHMNFVTNMNRWRDLPLGTNGERSVALIGVRRSGLLPFKIPSLRSVPDKIGMSFQKQISRSGFGFMHDGSVDSLVRFLQDSLEIQTDRETANLIAFLLCLNGSGLPQGSLTDRERPIGVESRDAPAALGKQITLPNDLRSSFLTNAYALVRSPTNRVDLIVKGFKDGIPRGWVYDSATRAFVSDRLNETISPSELEALASPENPITFTLVARGTGVRLGIDRDEDGYPDRTELDANSRPADASSVPIIFLSITSQGNLIELSWKSTPGKRYRIDFKDTLSDKDWVDTGIEVQADSSVARATAPKSATDSQRYYRIRELE